MKSLAAFAALVIAVVAAAAPSAARDEFVFDDAHLLSATAVTQVNAKVTDFAAQTRKEVVVVTVPSFDGTAAAAEERAFAEHRVNGVMLFIAKQPKTLAVVTGSRERAFFPPASTTAIRNAMRASFNSGDFDGGVNNGVDLALSQFRSHLGSLRTRAEAPVAVPGAARNEGGFNMSWIWWGLVLLVIFFIVRGIFRALAGPPAQPPGYGPGPGYGAPGYGQPGYGMGGGMGGGGFWSGLLGGLGGAWLGNELFGRGGMFGGGGGYGGGEAGMDGGQQQDASGWQNDAGQADMGNSSSGDYGSGGGSGGGDWGGGDSGGGGWGGGDSGGGDGGGGW